jgi:hypothetical protein
MCFRIGLLLVDLSQLKRPASIDFAYNRDTNRFVNFCSAAFYREIERGEYR